MSKYDDALQRMADTKTTDLTDVVFCMAWGIASAGDGAGDKSPDHRDHEAARSVYHALSRAGFRVVRL